MKQNRNFNQIKIDSVENEEDAGIEKIKMHYFSNQKQKNSDNFPIAKTKLKRRALRESSLSPTIEHDDEFADEATGRLSKTDGRTYQKIMNFVQDANHTWDETPEEHARKVGRSHCKSNADFELPAEKMYRTLTEQPEFRKSSIKFGATGSVFHQTSNSKFEKLMIHKLAYEWKKIYRNLTTVDAQGTGVVKISDFQKVCERNGVSIIPLEIKQLLKLYSVASDAQDLDRHGLEHNPDSALDLLNYKRLSVGLGLHKDSYNYLNKVQSMNRIQNINKLRQLYQSNERRQQQLVQHGEEPDESSRLVPAAAKNYKSTNGLQSVRHNQQLTAHGTQDAYVDMRRQKSSISQVPARKGLHIMQASSMRGRSLENRKPLNQNRAVAASQTLMVTDSKRHDEEGRNKKMYFLNKRNSHNDANGPEP